MKFTIFKGSCAFFLLLTAAFFVAQVSAEEEGFHRFWPDNLFAVEFVNDRTGFLAGQAGTVLRTHNGGETWEALFIGKPELIRRMSFVSESEGWAVGHQGSIFHTADGGISWNIQYNSDGVYLRDIQFFDNKHGWVVGHGAEILHTDDGGLHWQKQRLIDYEGRDLPRLHAIEVVDQQTAVLAGEFGVVAHTEDAGKHWTISPVETTVTWLSLAASGDCIYIVGLDGNAGCLTEATAEQRMDIDKRLAEKNAREHEKARKKAERRGNQYVPPPIERTHRSVVEYVLLPVETGTTEHLFDVVKTGDGDALAVGRSSIIRVMKDNAVTLTASEKLPIDFLWFGGVAFSAPNQFWAVGIQGLVVKGNSDQMNYEFSLSLPKSENIHLVSSRWVKENGR